MPGLAGFLKKSDLKNSVLPDVMAQLKYADHYIQSQVFEDDFLIGSGLWPHVFQVEKSMFENDVFVIWRDGDWFNESEVQKDFNFQSKGLGLIQEACLQGKLKPMLNRLDGFFSLVIYNKKEKTIQLISDRLGFKPLYYCLSGNEFGWSSELKGFFKMPFFKKEIQTESFHTFLKIGHLIGNQTWFKNTFLTDPASIHTFHLKDFSFSMERYWSWTEIKERKIKMDEAAEQLAFLIKSAVKKCVFPDRKYGLMLSGGLDSRTILAALPETINAELLTFGYPGTWDVNLAKKVAAEVSFPLNYQEILPENWLEGKKDAIWRTDGMKDMQHLHLSPFLNQFKHYQGTLDGILGGVLLGGIYAGKTVGEAGDSILKRLPKPYELNLDIFPESIPESFIIENRIRRFSTLGSGSISADSEVIYPFYDNRLLDFTLSLPSNYRKDSKLFLKALPFFKKPFLLNIPWQRTGLAPKFLGANLIVQKLKVMQVLRKLGLFPEYGFANYARWAAHSPLYNEMLNSSKLLLESYGGIAFDEQEIRNDFDLQTRMLTIAIWIESFEKNA
jgi:asparagine synthase (glutamine-hydrolysing)